MKKVVTIMAATAVSFQMYAQSVDEGIKMYQYERYETAKTILSSFADKDAVANYYYGLSLIELGDLAQAQKVFSKDDSYMNLAGRARILYIQNKPEDAQKLLEQITDNAKRREWDKYKVAADAITYTKGGSIPLAISWYLTAVERNDKNADLMIGLGDVYMKLVEGGGNAHSSYEKALEIDPNSSLAYSRVGRLWYVAQQYEEALKAYNSAKEVDPANPLPYRDLARAYQRAGNFDLALTNVEEFLSKSDQTVDNKITYANILYEAGKYDLAQDKMKELIAEGNERPYMYRIIAYTAFELENIQEAEDNLNQFFQKAAPEELINNDYIYQAKINAALAYQLKQTDAESPMIATYYQKVDQSLSHLKIEKDDQKADIYRDLGAFFKEVQDYKHAAEYYGKIVALEHVEATVLDYYYWGFWSFYAQNLEESYEAFEQMSKKFPNEGSPLYWQARVKAAQDPEAQGDEAIQAYEKWLAFDNENYNHADSELMVAYQYITFYYYNKENKEEALKYANKIKELDANNSFAQQIIDYFSQS